MFFGFTRNNGLNASDVADTFRCSGAVFLTFSPGLEICAPDDFHVELVDIIGRSLDCRLVHGLKSICRGTNVTTHVTQGLRPLLKYTHTIYEDTVWTKLSAE